jgi:ABC-type transport system involved in cytochrome bd biosynthesis fused ATPase/permease subunit
MLPYLLKVSQGLGQLNYYSDNASKTISTLFTTNLSNSYFKETDQIKISANNITTLEIKNLKILFDTFEVTHKDLKIFKGDKILIHGESGVGKSTMIKALLGIIKNQDNEILINGDSYSNWFITDVGYVDQSPIIFNNTILFNLTFCNNLSEIDKTKLWKVIETCNLRSVINCLEDLNYHLIQGQFSGGELQRINIARALYLQKGILIFDEATSGLNLEMAEEILRNIIHNFKDCILISITHQRKLFPLFERFIHVQK